MSASPAARRSPFWFLPQAVAAFRARYKDVTFAVSVCDHATALHALTEFATDLVLIFRPPPHPDLLPLAALGQRLVALMPRSHPLAGRTPLRLRDCAAWPVALPDHSFGTRQMIDQALARSSVRLAPALETNSFELLRGFVRQGEAISLQIEIGAPTAETDPDLLVRPLDDRDLLHGPLVLGQLRGRALPVATAKFAELLAARLHALRSLPEAP